MDRLPSVKGAGLLKPKGHSKSKGGAVPPTRLPQESQEVIDTQAASSSRPCALPSLTAAVPRPPPPSDSRAKKRTKEARRDKSERQALAPLHQTVIPTPSESKSTKKSSSPLVLPSLVPQVVAPSSKKETAKTKKKKKKSAKVDDSGPSNPGSMFPPIAPSGNMVAAAKPVVKQTSPGMCPAPPKDRPLKSARRSQQKSSRPVKTAKPDAKPSSRKQTAAASSADQQSGDQSTSPVLFLDRVDVNLPNSCFNNIMLLSMEAGQVVASAEEDLSPTPVPIPIPSPIPSPGPKPELPDGPVLKKRVGLTPTMLAPAPPPERPPCSLPAIEQANNNTRRRRVKKAQTSGQFMLP